MINASTYLYELELSARTFNALENAGYLTVGQVLATSDAELLKIANFGRKSLKEVRDAIGYQPNNESTPDEIIENIKVFTEVIDSYEKKLADVKLMFDEKNSEIGRALYQTRKELDEFGKFKNKCLHFIDYVNSQASNYFNDKKFLDNTWQSMECAPTDGTYILVVTKSNRFYVASYRNVDGSGGWYFATEMPQLNLNMVLAWRPLPSLPKDFLQLVQNEL